MMIKLIVDDDAVADIKLFALPVLLWWGTAIKTPGGNRTLNTCFIGQHRYPVKMCACQLDAMIHLVLGLLQHPKAIPNARY